MVENRCPSLARARQPSFSSSTFSLSPVPLVLVLSAPPPSDVYRVKLPLRYSSNFRSDEVARNCNDVFGRLTYRLGNLFIRVARRERTPSSTSNLLPTHLPARSHRRRGKCMESLATYGHTPRETETSAVCGPRRQNKNREWKRQLCGVSHRRRDKNTSSPADVSTTTAVAVTAVPSRSCRYSSHDQTFAMKFTRRRVTRARHHVNTVFNFRDCRDVLRGAAKSAIPIRRR